MNALQDRLPTERPTAASPRKVLGVLALAGATAALLNALAGAVLAERTTNRAYWLVGQKWGLLEGLPAPVDWLIVGDSSCNQGIRPEIFEERLGQRAVNVCTVADMLAVGDAWMLERYIERHGPPKHVLMVHVYDMWQRDLRSLQKQPLLAKIPLDWGYWRALTPALDLDAGAERSLWVARYLPLWAENKTLASWLRHPSKLWRRDFTLTPEGFMPLEKANPKGVRKDAKQHFTATRSKRFKLSRVNAEALGRVRELADEHGFDVWIAPGPLWEGAWKEKSFVRYFESVMDELAGFAATSARMHVLFREPMTFPEGQMENADHLVAKAAVKYTERLIEAYRAASGQEKGP